MADLEKLRANLEARGFRTTYFPMSILESRTISEGRACSITKWSFAA